MKYYVIKVGCMYLEYIYLSMYDVCTDFISEIKLTASKNEAMILDKEVAKELSKKIYIVLGSEVDVCETDSEFKTEV